MLRLLAVALVLAGLSAAAVPRPFRVAGGLGNPSVISLSQTGYSASPLNVISVGKSRIDSFGGKQYITYIDTSLLPQFIVRTLSTNTFASVNPGLPAIIDNDEHRFVSVGVDGNGYLHVSYGMHNQALIYYKSNSPNDPSAFSTATMTGSNESSLTYPMFLRSPTTGEFYVTFRNNGSQFFYHYNLSGGTWAAATGTGSGGEIITETGSAPAYLNGAPKWDASGNLWFSWQVFASGGGFNSIGTQYLMKWDGSTFKTFSGAAQTIPATHSNTTAIFTVAAGTDMIIEPDFAVDNSGVFYIPYQRYDGGGIQQVYVLESSTGSFVEHQLTSLSANLPSTCGSPNIECNVYPTAIVAPNGIAYVVYPDVFSSNKTIAYRSSDHFSTSGLVPLLSSYSPNFSLNPDQSRVSGGNVDFLWMNTGYPQYGFNGFSPSPTNVMTFNEWVP